MGYKLAEDVDTIIKIIHPTCTLVQEAAAG